MYEKKVRDIYAKLDYIGRDQVNITYNLKMPIFKPPQDLEQLRTDYLKHLRGTYRALDFKGIPQLDTFSKELLLEDIYVPLLVRPEMPAGETWERRLAGRVVGGDTLPEEAIDALDKSQSVPTGVEEALGKHKQVVVLGDPGSGKTTLLKHLTLRLASEPEAPLPILLALNAYASILTEGDCNLQECMPRYFAGLGRGMTELAPLFDSAIAQGRAVILLDGLDEVQRDRQRLVHKVEVFAQEVVDQGNKVIVTSRIVGYRESSLDARS